MAKKYSPNLAPAVGSTFPALMANLLAYKPALSYLPRTTLVALVSGIGIPFRFYERLRTSGKIARTELKKDPIFILGHWRSGTTHIHNLLCQDPQFGFISLDHALFPGSFLTTGVFRQFLKIFMPETRPMDNMKLALDAPQEDELALSNMMRHSMYNGWQFPRQLMQFYRRNVEFENLSPAQMDDWWVVYRRLMQTATYNMQGRQLVLKNPPHTARVKELLEHYPNARFIHIYRNPFKVYSSTMNLYRKAVIQFNFQPYADEQMEGDLIEIYRRMMKRYFETADLIPPNQRYELRYEDIEGRTLEVLRDIYEKLGLDGYEQASPRFETYLDSLGTYQKNKFSLAPEKVALVQKAWGFALDHWGYNLPE